MSERKRIELVIQKRRNKNIRRKNLIIYFIWFVSKHHLPWLKKVLDAYKASGEYPLIPCRELAIRYTDKRDREVAAFMGYAIRYKGDYETIRDALDEIGEHPWEWFVNRGFVRLSVGDAQNEKTCGQINWKIARMYESLHRLFSDSECDTIGEAVLQACKNTLTPLDQYMEKMFEECEFNHKEDELHTLIMVLSAADGIGLSIWAISQVDIRCPLTSDVRAFLRYWWPNITCDIPIRECFQHFGFSEGDFFIVCLAYARLRELRPLECAEYEAKYLRWFNTGTHSDYRYWRRCQEKIGFVF